MERTSLLLLAVLVAAGPCSGQNGWPNCTETGVDYTGDDVVAGHRFNMERCAEWCDDVNGGAPGLCVRWVYKETGQQCHVKNTEGQRRNASDPLTDADRAELGLATATPAAPAVVQARTDLRAAELALTHTGLANCTPPPPSKCCMRPCCTLYVVVVIDGVAGMQWCGRAARTPAPAGRSSAWTWATRPACPPPWPTAAACATPSRSACTGPTTSSPDSASSRAAPACPSSTSSSCTPPRECLGVGQLICTASCIRTATPCVFS